MTMEQVIRVTGNIEQWRQLIHTAVYLHREDSQRQERLDHPTQSEMYGTADHIDAKREGE